MLSQQAPARPFSLARRTRVAAQSLTRRSLGIICSSTPAAAPALPNSNGNGAHVAIVSAQGTSPAAAAAPAPAPAPLPGVVPPPAAYNNVVAAGATKAAMPGQSSFVYCHATSSKTNSEGCRTEVHRSVPSLARLSLCSTSQPCALLSSLSFSPSPAPYPCSLQDIPDGHHGWLLHLLWRLHGGHSSHHVCR